MKDILERHTALVEDVRKLETGAHKTPVDNGGYGYNSAWMRVAGSGLSKIYAAARSDYVYFKTTGAGVAFEPTQTGFIFTVPFVLAPTHTGVHRIPRRGGGIHLFRIRANGMVYAEGIDDFLEPLGKGYPLG